MESEHLPESEEARFNVIARLPEGAAPESVIAGALSAGIPPERVDALVQALKQRRAVRLAVKVNQTRAERVQQEFAATGLEIMLEALLTLAPVVARTPDSRYTCPGCDAVVVLPANRQCPACGVFVDKVPPEAVLRRKIMAQERARVAQAAERIEADRAKRAQEAKEEALRMKIRAELEAEYGLQVKPALFSGRAGVWRALGLVALTGSAFGAGWGLQQMAQGAVAGAGRAPASQAGPELSQAAIDRVMGAVSAQGLALDAVASGAAGLPAPNGTPTGASTGSNPELVPGALSGQESLANIAAARQKQGEDPRLEAVTGASAASTPGAAADSLLSPNIKTALVADFAVKLAELGQLPRAQEVLGRLKATPGLWQDPSQAATARLAEYQVQAWAVRSATRPLEVAEALRSDLQRLPDAAQRAIAMGRVGVILAQFPNLPAGLAQSFLLRGGDALKGVGQAAQRSVATQDWLLSMGRYLAEDIREQARMGRWNRMEGLVGQLDAVAQQAQPGPTMAGLRGHQVQVRRLLGQAEPEAVLIKTALREIAELDTPLARAEALRHLGQRSGDPGQAKVQGALRGQANTLEGQKGPETAYALARLSLLLAESGQKEAAGAMKAKALVVPGLSRRETVGMDAELLVGAELAQAEQLHRAGQLAAAEQLLRELAYKLL